MKKPTNPLVWIGYYCARWEKTSEISSFALGLIGSGILGSCPWVGVPAIVLSVLLFASLMLFRSQRMSLDETSSARDLLLEQSLGPLLESLASAAVQTPTKKTNTTEKLTVQACSELAYTFATIRGVRVCVFTISDDGQRMSCAEHKGRNQRPNDFERNTPRGDKAFEVLAAPTPYIFAADLDGDEEQVIWAGSGEGYRTFISAPIRSTDSAYGLLTIDAPKAGDLDDRHGQTVALYASALAVAYAWSAARK